MAASGSEPVYSIGAVARMLAVTPTTLRAWEDRYGVVTPARSNGDQRLYSRDQVDQLRFVQTLMADGLQAADAHRVLAQRIDDGMTLAPDPPETAGTAILLAERDAYSARMIEHLLRTEGYEVAIAFDVQDALDAFARISPALAVVELVTSGGDGVGLCRDLAAAGARVIAVSALDLGDAALRAGAEAFLRKPLDPLQTVATVRDLLGASAPVRRSTPVRDR
jgi:DNA-binding transcriptional MerR regulator